MIFTLLILLEQKLISILQMILEEFLNSFRSRKNRKQF